MTTFKLSIRTPSRVLYAGEVTEVIVPSHDGEIGIRSGHEDFIGLLGTGVVKVVNGGNDYWYTISQGVYHIESNQVKVLAQAGENADEVNVDAEAKRKAELEPIVQKMSSFDEDYQSTAAQYALAKARIEAHRRTSLVN
ncbi:ATP synthase F1 subunit epsilon [bacterium]|nr:ATP synthase F1 subunit epsilon [bacterium]